MSIELLKIMRKMKKHDVNEPVAWMYDVDGEIDSRLHFYKPLDCASNIKNVIPLYASARQQTLSVYVVMTQHMLIGVYRSKEKAENLVYDWSKKDK